MARARRAGRAEPAARRPPPARRASPPDRSSGEQHSQDVLKDAAVAEILGLARGVDAHSRFEAHGLGVLAIAIAAVAAPRAHEHLAPSAAVAGFGSLGHLGDAFDRVSLLAAQTQRLGALPVGKL